VTYCTDRHLQSYMHRPRSSSYSLTYLMGSKSPAKTKGSE